MISLLNPRLPSPHLGAALAAVVLVSAASAQGSPPLPPSDASQVGARTWFDLTPPRACLTSPWGETEANVASYFASRGVPVYEVRVHTTASTCEGCHCPPGRQLAIQVDSHRVPTAERFLPWRPPARDVPGVWVVRVLSGPPQCGQPIATEWKPLEEGPGQAGDSRDAWRADLEAAGVEVLAESWEEYSVCMACSCPSWAGAQAVKVARDDLVEALAQGFQRADAGQAARLDARPPSPSGR